MKLAVVVLPALVMMYYLGIQLLFLGATTVQEYPALRHRLGTIMHHSSANQGVDHLYCYYPSSVHIFEHKSGEYLIKRARSLTECSSWHGAAIFTEGSWVSEREKIWWSETQKSLDGSLAQN